MKRNPTARAGATDAGWGSSYRAYDMTGLSGPTSSGLRDGRRARQLLALADRPTFRLLGLGIGLVAAVAVLAGITWWVGNGYLAGDTLTYWLAGHRLDIGHGLYSVRPDDPWLFDIRPYGLLSPPSLAVPWIGLAALPGTSGMLLWWVTMAFCAAWAVAAILLGTRGWAGILVLPLVPALTLLVGVGNVDSAILAGVIGSWMLRDHARALGFLVAVLVSVKLTPAVLVVWLIATERWRALAWCVASGIFLAILTAAVLSVRVFVDYAGVLVGASSSGNPAALLVVVAGLGCLLLLHRHERLAFALAVVLIPIGSPVAAAHTWALLVGSLAPATRERRQ